MVAEVASEMGRPTSLGSPFWMGFPEASSISLIT